MAEMRDIRFFALVTALVIYGFWGSPTPDNPGLAEAAVGLLLVLASSPSRVARKIFRKGKGEAGWETAGRLTLLYGITVPVVAGLVNANDTGNMLRDIFPFLFLLMPFFLKETVLARKSYRYWLVGAAVFIGLAFSLRSQFPHGFNFDFPVFSPIMTSEQLYLVNAPTVLFTAIVLISMVFERLTLPVRRIRLAEVVILAVAGAIPVSAMAAAMQRASMGVLALLLAGLAARVAIFRPLRLFLPLFAIAAGLLFLWPEVTGLWEILSRKTVSVGLNNRLQEAQAVMENLHDGFLPVIFGKGWGAVFSSPAVGGVSVNFTHSLITSLWLKTGLAGMVLSLSFVFLLAVENLKAFRRFPLAAFALAAPLLINTFLYASYKSMDFGIILLLIVMLAEADGKLRRGVKYSNENGLRLSPRPESG